MSKHTPGHAATETKVVLNSDHYSTKNWSKAFCCPACGRTRRYNTNFLGQGKPFCTGVLFKIVRTFGDLCAIRETRAAIAKVEGRS